MANPTTNLGMTKPTVGGSTDSWGTTLNVNVVDIIDALFSISGTDVTMSDIKFNSMSVQETGAGTDTVKIQAPSAVSTSYTLTMPAAVGSTNQVLSAADGSGTLAWTTPEVGDITSVVAGAGMTGGGTSGAVTLNVIGTSGKITASADAVTIASDYVGQSSITTLGTVGTGTWQGTAVANAYVSDALTISGGSVDNSIIGASTAAAGTFTQGTFTQIDVEAQGDLRLQDAAGGQYVAFQAAGTTTSYTLTMPAAVPSANEVLTASDGSGTLSWAAPTTGDITAITAGTGLSGTNLTGPVPTLNVDAAQTQITSVGALGARSISSGFGAIDVGSSSIDGGTITGTFAGNITGNVTGNTSGTAATVTGAAQSAITSVGTLTSMTTSGDVIIGTNPAAAGDIRLNKNFGIFTRNDANDANKAVVSENTVTGNGTMDIGDNTQWTAIRFHCSASNVMELTATAINLNKATTMNNAAIKMTGLGTSDPGVAGQLWNSSGDVRISAG